MTAPTRRPRGRPRSDASRGSRLELRVHPTEAVLLGQAAELTGEAVAAWVRGVAVEAARAALAEHGPMPDVALCRTCEGAGHVVVREAADQVTVACLRCGAAEWADTRRAAIGAWAAR